MKEHPILFSGEMVRALLADRKHVTRRLSPQWLKVKAGDRLWVRETLRLPISGYWEYGADGAPVLPAKKDESAMIVWTFHNEREHCPSIHMPRWASRILLECEEDARQERLQDITEEDAIAEGVESYIRFGRRTNLWRVYGNAPGAAINYYADPRSSFRSLWESLHTKPGERWEDNPLVVRVGKFRRIG